jgi:two-component system LytT family response regulator
MKLLIVDDEPLSRVLNPCLVGEVEDVAVGGEAASGAEALSLIAECEPDAVFLDISMPGRSGIQTALDVIPRDIDIVFLTAHEEYAIDAFELGAADYVLKPLRRPRLAKALERLRQRRLARRAAVDEAKPATAAGDEPDVIWVPVLRGVARVVVADIIRVEAARDHVYFHTRERAYLYRTTMAELETRLATAGLIRVHRSAFVRPDAVTGINRRGKITTLTLADGVVVHVGPRYRGDALATITGAVEE